MSCQFFKLRSVYVIAYIIIIIKGGIKSTKSFYPPPPAVIFCFSRSWSKQQLLSLPRSLRQQQLLSLSTQSKYFSALSTVCVLFPMFYFFQNNINFTFSLQMDFLSHLNKATLIEVKKPITKLTEVTVGVPQRVTESYLPHLVEIGSEKYSLNFRRLVTTRRLIPPHHFELIEI